MPVLGRPSYVAVVGIGIGLALVVALVLVPPGRLWRSIDRAGYAAWNVRNAATFTDPVANDAGGGIDEPVHSWRSLADMPGGADAFAAVVQNATPAGRLYALAGMALLDSGRAQALAVALTRDTASVVVNLQCATSTRRVQDMVPVLLQKHWAVRLHALKPQC